MLDRTFAALYNHSNQNFGGPQKNSNWDMGTRRNVSTSVRRKRWIYSRRWRAAVGALVRMLALSVRSLDGTCQQRMVLGPDATLAHARASIEETVPLLYEARLIQGTWELFNSSVLDVEVQALSVPSQAVCGGFYRRQ